MQSVDACVTRDATHQNDTFPRSFNWWGPGWLFVGTFFLISMDYDFLHARPHLLWEWQGATVILLSLVIIAIYSVVAIKQKAKAWPPPLLPSLAAFFCIYGAVVTLALIDSNFSYDFYIVLGILFSRFASRLLLLLTTILVISMCILGHIVTFPFSLDQIGAIIGVCLSFYASAASAIIIQNMIGERYKRNRLLTELTQAHEALEQAHQKLADSAAQEQELAVLRERNRLAREMHDTLGHALVLVTVKLEVAQRLRERDPERCNHELEATQTIVRESMNELRASIANLRSPALEHEHACRALSRSAREMAQRTGITVIYDLQPDIEGLPEQIEETLWKVGQEAIANIEKHAHAHNVLLRISRCDSHVLLHLEDDGIGLPPDFCQHKGDGQATTYVSPKGHYGLSGMVERVERIGGTFHLRPATEHGVIVEVELPLVGVPAHSITA